MNVYSIYFKALLDSNFCFIEYIGCNPECMDFTNCVVLRNRLNVTKLELPFTYLNKLFDKEEAQRYSAAISGMKNEHVHVIYNLKLEERRLKFYDIEYDPTNPDENATKIDEIAFAMPLLISFIDQRAEIPMNELFERICIAK